MVTVVNRSGLPPLLLLPCPFCGEAPELRINFYLGTTTRQVVCTECLGSAAAGSIDEQAADLWNRRVSPSEGGRGG